MRLFIKVKTGQKEDKVVPPPLKFIPDSEEWYTVFVKERPVEGRANEAVIKLLAEHLQVSRSKIRLVSGAIAKRKVVEIRD